MKRLLITVAGALGIALLPASAAATNIELIYPPAADDAFFVGIIIDGIPSGDTNELGYVEDLVAVPAGIEDAIGTTDYLGDDDTGQTETYDRSLSTLVTVPMTGQLLLKDETENNKWTVPTDISGHVYILAKYDQDKAGDLVFLVFVNPGDEITVPDNFNKYGISHFTVFGAQRVPDGGATLMLLGVALLGLGVLRRRSGV